jgi:hypothetical protein
MVTHLKVNICGNMWELEYNLIGENVDTDICSTKCGKTTAFQVQVKTGLGIIGIVRIKKALIICINKSMYQISENI